MGCASSTPLVESGKNFVDAAKETATDAVNMGEKALHGKKKKKLINTLLFST